MVVEKKCQFFPPKKGKIAENCDHDNIDPRFGEFETIFSSIGRAKLFNEISSTGSISQDQWVTWAIEHITAKAASL
jgi:hypothetical protein